MLLPQVHHEFYYGKDVAEKLSLGCDGEIDDMLRIRLREAGSDEEMFTLVAWIRAFNINEPIYAEFCHEFYSTYEFDEVYADDELQSKKIIKFRLGGRAYNLTLLEFAQRLGLYQVVELEEEGFNVYFEGGLRNDDNFNTQDYWLSISREDNLDTKIWVIAKWMKRKGAGTQKESQICYGQFISKLARKCRVLTEDVVRSLSAPIYCRDLDTITLKDLIDSEGKLIPEDPQPGMPRVGIPRPPRASMQDLYDRMGRMEIRQDTIERMEYRQSYHWDSTISSTSLRHHRNNSRMMTSSVEMTRVGYVTAWDHEKEEKAREKLAQRKDSEYRSQLKISLDLSRLATTLNRLERSIQIEINKCQLNANDKAGFGHNGAKESKVSEKVASESKNETYDSKDINVEKPKAVRTSEPKTSESVCEPVVIKPKVLNDEPIIEEWHSDYS
ncbi:hypothetical protein Tco_1316369 [Tanacetum coccineum]